MINNKAILDKLKEKTGKDEKAYSMLLEMLELESEHKHFKKAYKGLIEADVEGKSNEN